MRRMKIGVVGLVVLSCSVAGVGAQKAAPGQDDEKKAVENVVRAFEQAVQNYDSDATVPLPGAAALPETPHPRSPGPEADSHG
jgi:hypothetical protein